MPDRDSATVLVVDDEVEVADSYAEQLESRYDVVTAYTGEQALDAIDEAVDVVLLDRRMPDISGDEVLAYVRDHGFDVEVAMVTAVDPDFDIIEMPFDDYVVKPVSHDELLDTVDRLLTCAKYQERLQEFYSVTVKYVALKQTKTSVELAESDEFSELRRRREELTEQLSELELEFDDRDFLTIIDDLQERYRPRSQA